MPLGDIINSARLKKGMGLRALARDIGIAASYLSDIENDRRVPSEAVLRDIARLLDLDFDLLMQQAGRLGEDAERYLRGNRLAGRLFRRIAESRLDQEALENLLEELKGKENPEGEGDARLP